MQARAAEPGIVRKVADFLWTGVLLVYAFVLLGVIAMFFHEALEETPEME